MGNSATRAWVPAPLRNKPLADTSSACSTALRGMQQLPWRRLAQLRIEHAHLARYAIPYLLQGGICNCLLWAVEGLQQGGVGGLWQGSREGCRCVKILQQLENCRIFNRHRQHTQGPEKSQA